MLPSQTTNTVNGHSWIQTSKLRHFDLHEHDAASLQKADLLDQVPVMSATVLGLEMLLQEPFVDLGRVSDLILSDVGATVQTLRLIAKEYDNPVERPSRMGECIASLDVDEWFGAISARTFVDDWEHSAATAAWKHCRLIAHYAQLVSESIEEISPDDAYLVGLLHGVGTIPTALGWQFCDRDGQDVLLAMEESLPLFVLAALRGACDSPASPIWRFILTSAHKLVCARIDYDSPALWGANCIAIDSRQVFER